MKTWLFRLFTGKSPKRKTRPATSTCLNLEVLENRVTPTLTYHGSAILPAVQAQALYLGSDWLTNPVLNSQTNPSNPTSFDAFLTATVGGSYLTMLGKAGFTGTNPSATVGPGSATAGAIDPISRKFRGVLQLLPRRVGRARA